jgi:hypothetical protein
MIAFSKSFTMVGKFFNFTKSGISVTTNAAGQGRKVLTTPPPKFDPSITKILEDQMSAQLKKKDAIRDSMESKSKVFKTKLNRQKMRDLKSATIQDGFLSTGIFADIKSLLVRIGCEQKQSFFVSILHLLIDLYFAESVPQYISSVMHFVRDVLPDTLVDLAISFFNKYVSAAFVEVQDAFFGENVVNTIHDLFNMKASAMKSKTWKKMCDFFNYVVSLLIGIGGTDEDTYFAKIKDLVTQPIDLGLPLLLGLFESLIYLMKQGYQAFHVRHPMSFFFNETSLATWIEEVDAVNLDLININSPDILLQKPQSEILARMQALLSRAREMKSCIQGVEGKILKDYYTKLMISATNLHNSMTASKFRKAPFTMLINGEPSVGKTSFLSHCHIFFAKIMKLSPGEEGKYVRQFWDAFWSGFKTTHWCIIFDDISFEKVDKVMSLASSSQADLIQVANNMTTAPNMANLEDKGKVFCMPRLVLATTNCKHLNAQSLFQTPYAVLRRFPHVITLEVKPEFADSNGGLDLTQPNLPEEFKFQGKDWWLIHVEKPVAMHDQEGKLAPQPLYRKVATFDTMADFRRWMKAAVLEHERVQEQIVNFHTVSKTIDFCDACFEELTDCKCSPPELISGSSSDSEEEAEIQGGFSDFYHNTFGEGVDPSTSVSNYLWYSAWFSIIGQYICAVIFCFCTSLSIKFYITVCFFIWLRQICIHNLMIALCWYLWCCTPRMLQKALLIWYSKRFAKGFIKNHRHFIGYIQGLAALVALYKGYGIVSNCMKFKSDLKAEQECRDYLEKSAQDEEAFLMAREDKDARIPKLEAKAIVQGGAVSVPDIYLETERSVAFDFGSKITSWKAMSNGEALSKIQENIVRVHSKESHKTGCGIFIQGQVLITNYHLFAGDKIFQVKHERRVDVKTGWMTIPDKDIVLDIEHDLMAIRFRNIPPMKDLIELIPQNIIVDMRCAVSVLTRQADNNEILIHGSKYCYWGGLGTIEHPRIGEKSFEYYSAVCNSTIKGDCGSPYVAHSPFGPCIIALHQNVKMGVINGVALKRSIVEELIGNISDGVQGGSLLREGCSFALQKWSKDSNLRRIENPHCYVFGTSQRRFPSKSHVTKSLLYEECVEHGFKDEFAKPVMKDRQVWINQATPMVEREFKIDIDLLDEAVELFTDESINSIPVEDFSIVRKLDDDEALNGVHGMNYVDKIPRKTSAGFPHNCSKMKFLDFIGDRAILNEDIQRDASDVEKILRDGCRSMPVFMGSLKDEVISSAKAEMKKTRMFTGSPLAFSLVMRKYLLTVNAFIQGHRSQFECCVGVDALGPEWDDIASYLESFSDNFIAGDYANYDKKMTADLILAAGTILERICRTAGYAEEDLRVVHTLVYDLAFPVMNFDGDIVMTCGSEPSGHPLTVIVNSIVGSLLLRMAFINLKRTEEIKGSFKDNVRAVIYGDDNLMGSKLQSYNHTYLQNFFSEQGLVYTMAEKGQESIPFISLKECTFLKRDFYLHPRLKTRVGRLSEKSIRKMLMYRLPKGSMDSANHAIEVMDTSCREMFFWGEEKFNDHRDWCLSLVEKLDLQECVRPSDFHDFHLIEQWYLDKWNLHQTLPLKQRTFYIKPEVQCGWLEVEEPVCDKCLHDDCEYFASDSVICKRCSRCRPSGKCRVDKWFLGCLHCEINYPLHCDCCYGSTINMQTYEKDGLTTHFYCKQCFDLLELRSNYIVLKKQSNGSYRRDPVNLTSDFTRLSIRENNISIEEIPFREYSL